MDRAQFNDDCELAARFFSAHEPNGTCRGCGVALSGRRTIWCSVRCSNKRWTVFAREHDWNDARRMAMKRDKKRCVLCGADGNPPADLLGALEAAERRAIDALAAVRRKPKEARKRGEHTAALRARKEASEAVRVLKHLYQLEVDHIVPRRGGGYGLGCWNHLSNLRTLCHADHVAVTNRQRFGSNTPSLETERSPAAG